MVKHQISAPAPARGGAFGTFFFPLPLPPIAGVVVCRRARRPSGTEKMHRDRTESSQNKVTAALRQLTGSYLPASSAAAIFSVTVTTVTVFLTLTGANNSRQLTAVPSLIHMSRVLRHTWDRDRLVVAYGFMPEGSRPIDLIILSLISSHHTHPS